MRCLSAARIIRIITLSFFVFATFLRIRDGKIVEYKEYSDTHYAHRVLDVPQIRGPLVERVRTFDTAVATFTGNAVAKTMQSA